MPFDRKNKNVERKGGKFTNLSVIVGLIVSAFVASICCLGPAVLSILSIAGAGLFFKFEAFRPYFIVLTVFLLGLAFYLTYRKREVVCEDGTCKIEGASKWNKIALWIATVFVVFFISFPYLDLSTEKPLKEGMPTEIIETTIDVKGMTCIGCEFSVERALKKLDGIIEVKADYKRGKVYVKFERDKITVDKIVDAINETGYEASKP